MHKPEAPGSKMRTLFVIALQAVAAAAVSITDIQGPAFRSPLEGQNVQNVSGIVTAKVSLTGVNGHVHLTQLTNGIPGPNRVLHSRRTV